MSQKGKKVSKQSQSDALSDGDATIAQSVEQLIRNEKVEGSTPSSGIKRRCGKHGDLTIEHVAVTQYKGKTQYQCRQCNRERARKHYANPEKRAKKQEKDRKYWEENKKAIMERRKRTQCNDKRRLAYCRNADAYRQQCNAKQAEYRRTLSDSYIKKLIQNGDKEIKFEDIPDSLVRLAREKVRLRREIKRKQRKERKDSE